MALCGEDSRGSAEGQEMVSSEARRGEGVSMTIGNPPSRRDHRTGLPVTGHVGWESCEQGQGGCQGQSVRESVMVPQMEAWAAQALAVQCPGLSLSSAKGTAGL